MHSNDLTLWENNRGDAIKQLMLVCDTLGLSYSYTLEEFTISLPHQEPLPIVNLTAASLQKNLRRKTFDINDWGPKGIDESELPTELPPTTTPLDEGQPPEGDDEP